MNENKLDIYLLQKLITETGCRLLFPQLLQIEKIEFNFFFNWCCYIMQFKYYARLKMNDSTTIIR